MKLLKNFAVFSVLSMLSLPLFAQSRSVDIIGFGTLVDPSGNSVFESNGGLDDLDVQFDSEQGFGAAVNIFWSRRFSTELAASIVEPDLQLRSQDPAAPLFATGSLEMIPITGVLQFHLSPDGKVDPYIGAGVAYVLFDQVNDSGDLGDIDVETIDFDDDAGLVLNAGLSIDITPRLAIYLDGKYVPVKSSATATFATGPGTTTDIDINPLIISAGLGFQF